MKQTYSAVVSINFSPTCLRCCHDLIYIDCILWLSPRPRLGIKNLAGCITALVSVLGTKMKTDMTDNSRWSKMANGQRHKGDSIIIFLS